MSSDSDLLFVPSLLPVSDYTTRYDVLLCRDLLKLFRCVDAWVSVGSGKGVFEEKLVNKGLVSDGGMICVDPLAASGARRKANYSDVEELVKEQPAVVGTAGCLLIHPEPNDDFRYDLDAIKHLKPPVIVLFYCSCGAAGSKALHGWIDDGHPGYGVLYKDCFPRRGLWDMVEYTVTVFVREDRKSEFEPIKRSTCGGV